MLTVAQVIQVGQWFSEKVQKLLGFKLALSILVLLDVLVRPQVFMLELLVFYHGLKITLSLKSKGFKAKNILYMLKKYFRKSDKINEP